MKLNEFTPELGIWLQVEFPKTGLRISGIIRNIEWIEEGKTWAQFDLEDDITGGFNWTFNAGVDCEIIKAKWTDEAQIYKEEQEVRCAGDTSYHRVMNRKDYIARLIEQGDEPITKEDIKDVMEDIDIYNGLCRQRREHEQNSNS